jgi:hypothetical protein
LGWPFVLDGVIVLTLSGGLGDPSVVNVALLDMKAPNMGGARGGMIDETLVFEVRGVVWLESARFSVMVASFKPLEGLNVAVGTGDLSMASFFSFGRSWKCTSSSRVLRMRSNASLAIKELVSFPWSASMLAGSDVITRVAFAIARRVAP